MTPEERAKQFITMFYQDDHNEAANMHLAKKNALIAIEEIIKVCPYLSKEKCETVEQLNASDDQFVEYWQEVKKSIENL